MNYEWINPLNLLNWLNYSSISWCKKCRLINLFNYIISNESIIIEMTDVNDCWCNVWWCCRKLDRCGQQQRSAGWRIGIGGIGGGSGRIGSNWSQSASSYQRIRPVARRQGMAECPLRSPTEPGWTFQQLNSFIKLIHSIQS